MAALINLLISVICWYTSDAKSLQSCPTLCNHIDGSPPGSPVPGIFQARTRSGLPFPSPMHDSEKWKWSRSVLSNSSLPHGLQPTRLLCPWDFPGKSTGVGCHCLLHDTHQVNTNSHHNQSTWIHVFFFFYMSPQAREAKAKPHWTIPN